MSIIFAGALAPEFANGNLITDVVEAFDPNYAPGALAVTAGDNVTRMVGTPMHTGATDVWVHFNYYQTERQQSSTNLPLIGLYGTDGSFMGGIAGINIGTPVDIASVKLTCGNELAFNTGGTSVYSLLPINKLVSLDLHYTADGVNEKIVLYSGGLVIAEHMLASSRVAGIGTIRLGSLLSTSPAYFSEIIVTAAGEQSLGWRLSSMMADADGHLTEWEGTFADLATVDTATGIHTDKPNKRHTGLFEAYNGATNPLGIRALVQVGRYIESESGLTVVGMLYDIANTTPILTYGESYTDEARSITVWDVNPVTAEDWQPAEFVNFEGGFKSLVA